MATAVVLFTRDLRVHDQPALHAAFADADRVVPLFVLDDAIMNSGYAAPNRLTYLLDALRDLRSSLTDRGGSLVFRRGRLVDEVAAVCRKVDADELHLSADVSTFAQAREHRLAGLAGDLDVKLILHPGVTVVAPGELAASGSDHFEVFTPYWHRWRDHQLRPVLPAPNHVQLPPGLPIGRLPAAGDLVGGDTSPELVRGGESRARQRLDAWLDGPVNAYVDEHDALDHDATSRLSADLHFGCLSGREIVDRLDRQQPGQDAYLRQLCWRDFHHQVTWAAPTITHRDHRPRGDRWREDRDGLDAWCQGRTGFPIVDAAMRQLLVEGWMHNRARMIVASFLCKDLYVDWRLGAAHFAHWLVDGDIANNWANWQWVAGTGTDTRPNRVYNPVTQGKRFDPDGAYIRRYVPELGDVDTRDLHDPDRLAQSLLAGDYPPPIADHAEARERFLDARNT